MHPKSWENPELLIIPQAKEQYTAFMTFVSGNCKSGDNFVVPDCQQQDGPSRNQTFSASGKDPKMFFPKKVGEAVNNILTQEKLNSSLFCKWWANTKISNDFWIETPEAFFRIHVVPRKGVFDPRLWRTPWHEQRDFLLSELGAVRSTWAVLCSNHKAIPSVHDVWRDPGVAGPLGRTHGQVQHDGGSKDGAQVSGDDIFYDCFEGKEEMMEVGEIEGWARNLRRAKDFSFSSCEALLRHFCPHGAGKHCRGAHLKEDARVIAGAYAHGSVYGVVGITYKYPETIRYLNAFLKTLGIKGSWTALSVGWNCRTALHRDAHNARDRRNHTVTFGEFQGGRVWVEDSPLQVLHGRDEAPKDPYILKLPNGDSVKGGWYDTYKSPVTFPGHLRHLVEDWEGERFAITAYTPRGRDELSINERDLLRSFGFPVGNAEAHASLPLPPADREAAVRPKRSVRKGLWKQAMQASAMLTLSMTAVSSYFGELFSSETLKGPAILEIGGFDMTSRVADWGRDVVEPIDHDMFLGESGLEFVSNLTSALEPQVLWINAAPHDKVLPRPIA